MTDQDDLIPMLRRSAEDFVSGSHDPARMKGHIGEPRRINRNAWAEMAEMGWLGLALPEALGGSGMGPAEAAVLGEVFGAALFPEPFLAAALMPSIVVTAAHGHVAQDFLARQLATGARPMAVAWQEATGQTEATLSSMRYTAGALSGSKQFVCAVEDDSVVLVSAADGDGVAVWAVDARSDGLSRRTDATAQGTYSELRFDQVKPLHDTPLCTGDVARRALTEALAAARLGAAAQLTGVARGCLDKTVTHVSQRTQFGRTIGSFQSVQHRCVDMRIGVEMASASWRHAATLDADHAGRMAAIDAAKARAGDVAMMVGRTAVQLHGAMGFTEEADIGLFLRAAMQYSTWLGGGRALRRRFADWDLSAHGVVRAGAASEVAHG